MFYIESDRKGSEQEGDGNVRIKLPMGSEPIQTYIEEVNPKPALGPPSAMRKVVYLRQSPTGMLAYQPDLLGGVVASRSSAAIIKGQ